MCFQKPKGWANWLSLAEFWHNTTFHRAIKMSHFQANCGFAPSLPTIPSVVTHVAVVEEVLQAKESMTSYLKEQLTLSKNKMKQYANRAKTKREFVVGN